MSRRRSSRKKALNANDYLGVILFAIFFIISIAIAIYYYNVKTNFIEIDNQTFCPLNGPVSVTALLIDGTDSLTIQQKKALNDEFQILRNSIPVYGRLDLYFIKNNLNSLQKPIVSICNPGRGSQINPMIGNPKQVEKSWKDGFEAPLETELSLLLNQEPANKSPILESIQSVVLTSFSDPIIRDKPRKLILVSDLMQHSSNMSLYGNSVDINTFTKDKSFNKLKSDLRGVNISIWMLARENTLKRSSLVHFWEKIFHDQDGEIKSLCVLVESNRCQND